MLFFQIVLMLDPNEQRIMVRLFHPHTVLIRVFLAIQLLITELLMALAIIWLIRSMVPQIHHTPECLHQPIRTESAHRVVCLLMDHLCRMLEQSV